MILVIIILFVLLAIAIYKIISDRMHIANISEQLKISLYKDEHFVIKESGTDKTHNELIEQINNLNDIWREAQAKYNRNTQQSKEMIASITHDFRTPLTSMLGYIQILQETTNDESQIRYLNIIEKRTNSLNKLVDDFYDISILESEEYPVTITKINPIVILQEQLAMYYEDLTNHFEQVIINITEDTVFSNSDAKALNRIYGNLIKNAINHGTGILEISTAIVDNHLDIIINNNTNETINIDKLFDRTFRNDETRNSNSTGLGLSIAKELATVINAKLIVKQNDQTISFIISIPII